MIKEYALSAGRNTTEKKCFSRMTVTGFRSDLSATDATKASWMRKDMTENITPNSTRTYGIIRKENRK